MQSETPGFLLSLAYGMDTGILGKFNQLYLYQRSIFVRNIFRVGFSILCLCIPCNNRRKQCPYRHGFSISFSVFAFIELPDGAGQEQSCVIRLFSFR